MKLAAGYLEGITLQFRLSQPMNQISMERGAPAEERSRGAKWTKSQD
jgi:hypothetical protein